MMQIKTMTCFWLTKSQKFTTRINKRNSFAHFWVDFFYIYKSKFDPPAVDQKPKHFFEEPKQMRFSDAAHINKNTNPRLLSIVKYIRKLYCYIQI